MIAALAAGPREYWSRTWNRFDFFIVLVRSCKSNPADMRVESAWFQRLKLKCNEVLSSFTFNIKLRRYVLGSVLGLAFSFVSASFVRIVRLFRVSRMFRLIKSLKAGGVIEN